MKKIPQLKKYLSTYTPAKARVMIMVLVWVFIFGWENEETSNQNSGASNRQAKNIKSDKVGYTSSTLPFMVYIPSMPVKQHREPIDTNNNRGVTISNFGFGSIIAVPNYKTPRPDQ